MNLVKTFIFTVLVPGAGTVLFPYWILSPRRGVRDFDLGPLRWLGVVVILLGALIYLRCAWDFAWTGQGTPAPIDPPKKLVVRGLYRYVRNPMYVGVLSVVLGEALLFESIGLLELFAAAFATFFLFIVFYEEPTLRAKFGESYDAYRRAVPRWIPRLKRPRD